MASTLKSLALVVSSLQCLVQAAPAAITGHSHFEHPRQAAKEYDYVIAGGGLSALVVANRLTENPQTKVLVVEYGYFDNRNNTVLIPYNANFNKPRDLYNVTSVPQTGLDNRIMSVNTAGTVGGGTVVNGMFFDRASRADYDAWEELGNEGWGWEGLLPYFKKSTNFTSPTPEEASTFNYTFDDNAWGDDGPVHASFAAFEWPQEPYFFQAWGEINGTTIDYPVEGANGRAIGVFNVPSSQDPETETRSSARTAYYDPVQKRPNLHIITGTKVTKLTFEDDSLTASGFEMRSRADNQTVSVKASKEVVVAAGPIFSPNLLQISGVGPGGMLEEAGIQCKHALPGVGTNFQDHPSAYVIWNMTTNIYPTPATIQNNDTFYDEAEEQYFDKRTGPLILARGTGAAFLTLRTISERADAIVEKFASQDPAQYLPTLYDETATRGYAKQHAILLKLLNGTDAAVYEMPFNGDSFFANAVERPTSRGTITLNATDPHGWPVVDYNTVANPTDMDLAVEMLKFTRRFQDTPSIQVLGAVELVPGRNYSTDAQIEQVMRTSLLTSSFAHWCGGNPMMPLEDGGVVSPELTVYGTQKLSVVDSSIMPMIPATHLQATTYAIAEKAADLIKERTGWTKCGKCGCGGRKD